MKRVLWIDVARGIAILAVILEHILFIRGQYADPLLVSHTKFCVTWFIFLAGVTSAFSTRGYLTYWKKRLSLVGWYLLASVISFFWSGQKEFVALFWNIVLFSSSPPYYFFFVLFQLYLLFPIFWEIVKRIKNVMQFLFALTPIIVISLYVSSYNTYPWFYPPWKMPLAGTFAPVFFLGLAYTRWHKEIHKYIGFSAVILFFLLEGILVHTNGTLFFSNTALALFAWSLALLFIVKITIEHAPKLTPVWRGLAFLGKHSLVIFLFHYVIIQNFAVFPLVPLMLLAIFVPLLIPVTLKKFSLEYDKE